MLYGKLFASLYEGSMVGAGSHVFAVWGYVIAKQNPDRQYGSVVRIQPKILSAAIGETEEKILQAIDYLMAPDPKSTTKEKEGRRLIKLSEFEYQVVTGPKYRWIMNEESRTISNRQAKRKQRERDRLFKERKVSGKYLAAEARFCKAAGEGDVEAMNRIAAEGLPVNGEDGE